MKYQALILVIAILFSTLMLHALVAEERSVLSTPPLPESITRLGTYTVPSLAQKNKFQTASFRELPVDVPLQEPSPQGETSVVEKPSVGSIASSCSLSVAAYLVKDITHGKIIVSKNETGSRPIASVSKLMTTLVAMESMQSEAVITVSENAHALAEGYASLEVGASYTVQDLIRAALVVSSNDATYALAESFGFDTFVTRMNEKAKEIGMRQTIFTEPSGLSYLNQSTVSDLALLLAYIYQTQPTLLAITREKIVPIMNQTRQRTIRLLNVNYFAGTKNFIGGKTGFINESGGNLVALFHENSSVWAVEVLGSDDRFADLSRLLLCAQKMKQ
ncbi:MAG: serine hydrolase [Candidatus Paceibacterota bacterium]